jgi:hypothetical protein
VHIEGKLVEHELPQQLLIRNKMDKEVCIVLLFSYSSNIAEIVELFEGIGPVEL